MSSIIKPENAEQVKDAIAWAVSNKTPMELVGAGTKRGMGRPSQTDQTLSLEGLSGILAYEPEELIVTVLPGTTMAELEAALAEKNQMLAFEPMDMHQLYGGEKGAGTVGGMVACNLSGPRRIKAGAARDHLLGFSAVSGRGEIFKAGAKVVKNVTGYDLSKLVTGSFGTLVALTELTLKVLPAPEKTRTVLVQGLDDDRAVEAMGLGMNSPHEVASTAHYPAEIAAMSGVSYVRDADTAVTAVRIEGPGPSAEHRCEALREQLKDFGPTEELHGHNSAAFWAEVRDVTALANPMDRAVWRISVPPKEGARVAARIADSGDVKWYFDWSGGLIWMSLPDNPGMDEAVRSAFQDCGGHATLVCAGTQSRSAVPVFQPQPAALAALSGRVKESFDPERVLNPGRMYPGV